MGNMENIADCPENMGSPTRKSVTSSTKRAGGRYPKQRGNSFERELVNLAKDEGLPAQRSYASDGRSLGLTTDVDCLIAGKKIQAKRRKKVAKWLIPEDTVDCVATRPDRGDILIVMKYATFLDMLQQQPS